MKRTLALASILALVACACDATAREPAQPPNPAAFDAATAMRALYPGYDETTAVAPQGADAQVSALLATTYDDHGTTRGVLVAQRQRLYEGEVAWGHADTATVGVALFTRGPEGWVLARRVDELFADGSYGQAPIPAFVTDAAGGHWLWFTGVDSGQGLSYGYGVLVSVDAAGFAVAGRFATGGDNAGACAEDRAEWDELVGPCWSWQGAAELVGSGEHDVRLRLTESGTESDGMGADAKITRRRGTFCHERRNAQDAWVRSPRCPGRSAWRTSLPSGRD